MDYASPRRLTLYGDTLSGNCLKTRWIADALGLDYDWVQVDVVKGEARSAAFLAINPAGKVPLARWPDGRALPESNAIMLYLAETSPGGGRFLPNRPFERAQMMSWLFWEQYSHEPAIAVRRYQRHLLGRPDEEIDPALVKQGSAALAMMQMQLSHTDWLVGDGISLADVALVAYTRWSHEAGFDLDGYPAVAAWVPRVEQALGIPHARPASA